MNPEEIEIRILHTMLSQHFKSGGVPNATDIGISVEARLEDVDPNELRGEIDFLAKKGLLKIGGRGESGFQLFIGMESKGIEMMQTIMDKSMNSIPDDLKDDPIQTKLDEIKAEQEPIKKTIAFFNFALQNRKISKITFEIARSLLSSYDISSENMLL